MPNSPASSPTSKRSVSSAATRRSSTVSGAFNNGPTQDTSSAGSSASGGLSKRINVPTVGTMVNPTATAAELLSKTPSMQSQSQAPQQSKAQPSGTFVPSLKGAASSPPSGTFASSLKNAASSPPSGTFASNPKGAASSPTGVSGRSQSRSRSQAKSPGGGPSAPPAEMSGGGGSVDPEINPDLLRSNIGHGVVDVNMRTGAIIQIGLSVLAFILFVSLHIYVSQATCPHATFTMSLIKWAITGGWISSSFVLVHSCFERKVSSRGVYGCIIFFVLAIVSFSNLLMSFFALQCICSCSSGNNAWLAKSIEDLTIFGLSLGGSLCLIIILLVASVSRFEMEIFKVYESTMANVQPGQSMKHLRRDQLLDNYEAAASTLQTLMRAKETEIAHRKDLMKMLEESKSFHNGRLQDAKQEYQLAKSHIPESVDLKSIHVKYEPRSTTPPLPPPAPTSAPMAPSGLDSRQTIYQPPVSTTPPMPPPATLTAPSNTTTPTKGSEFDIPLPNDNFTNRSSLDRRLSEFMKTFPNLTQAGMAPSSNSDVKPPAPGYYTQQPPPPPPPMSTAPPSIDMLRFPPPNMMPPGAGLTIPPPPMMHHPHMNQLQENHDPADVDMNEEEGAGGGVLPMIASAMQRGAGGKNQPQSYVGGHPAPPQQFNTNPMPYTPRLNALPFDPSIMDPSLGGSPSSSSSSRDRHGSDKVGHRYSGGSGGSGSSKHGSGKKYASSSSSTSSHSSNRDKSRR